jgi:membrane protease YdiL (CAAX protease family)
VTAPWIPVAVNSLLLAALTVSLVSGIRFIANRKTILARRGRVPACPLTGGDLLLLGGALGLAGACRLAWLLPLLAVGGAVILYRRRGVNALAYWRWQPAALPFYARQGLRGYLLLLLPLTVSALLVAGLCQWLGVNFTQPQVELFMELRHPRQIGWFLFLAVIVAPVWEEVVFRGALYPYLKQHLPAGWAALLSSAAWAAIHLHWPVLPPFTLLGCALCFLYEQTGKLGCPVALHAIFNLTSMLLLLLLKSMG